MNSPWVCRAYQPGDETGIIELYRRVFQLHMTSELWHWMYQAPPGGPAIIVVLARDEELVGHYAVQPRSFWLAGREATFGLAVGTMVLPELRSVGALIEMAQKAYGICRERGISRLFAFPNDVAHRVRCALLGWQAQPEIIEWEGDAPTSFPSAASNAQTWREMPTQLDFSKLFRNLQQRGARADPAFQAARSEAWLRWRFFNRPENDYRLHAVESSGQVAAYAVSKRYVREGVCYGHILDLQIDADAKDLADTLLDAIWRQFSEWSVKKVSCWARGRIDLGKLLTRAGLAPVGKKTNFCQLEITDNGNDNSCQAMAWKVEMADSDIY
jgi:hypothetical protein